MRWVPLLLSAALGVLMGVEFTSRQVRPGDPFAMTIKFRNDGTRPARSDYYVFVHFTQKSATRAEGIVYQNDHMPPVPTSQWQAGTVVEDGPHTVEVPPESGGPAEVPPYGFIIDSPTFVAFCATRYNGVDYARPTLFTARSLDGKPLAQSAKVRVYHGFGENRLRLHGRELQATAD
jgi:hypothetical protein